MKRQLIYDKNISKAEALFRVSQAALLDKNRYLKGAAFKVLHIYINFEEQSLQPPTTKEIFNWTGFSDRTIAKAHEILIGNKYLEFIPKPSTNISAFTRYRKELISEELRWEIFERDNFTCRDCGIRRRLTIDHIKPEKLGGTLDKNNLRTLCRSCNAKKGIKEI